MNRPPHWEHVLLPPEQRPDPDTQPTPAAPVRPGWIRRLTQRLTRRSN